MNSNPRPTLEAFRKVFEKIGVGEVYCSELNSREEANGDELCDMLLAEMLGDDVEDDVAVLAVHAHPMDD